MSNCVEKLPHACGSSDGLQVFEQEGKYTGFCFACGTYVPDPYEEGHVAPKKKEKPSEEQIRQTIQSLSDYRTVGIPSRKLLPTYLAYFGVRTGLDKERAETVTSVHFPYYRGDELVSYFNRILDNKKMQWFTGSGKDLDPFGWKQAISAGAKRLYVTEGEFDAVALFQIFKQNNKPEFSHMNPAIISVSNGSSSAVSDLTRMREQIGRYFQEIVLVFDMDEPGQKAAQDVCRIFPEAKVVALPRKDANDCLIEGVSKAAFAACMWNAGRPKNTRLILGSTLREAARKKPEWGLSWPWPKFNEATRGIRRGETIYLGSGVKMGKSEVVDTLATHLITVHNKTVLFCKPEQGADQTYKRLVGKKAGRIFHDPKIEFDDEAFDAAEPLIGDKAVIIDNYQFVDWKQLRLDIIDAVTTHGVEDVFIDPITCLTNTLGSGDANEELTKIAAEISAMAKDYNFTAYLFCHLLAPNFGPPHEFGGKIFSNQFAGSRAMMRACNYSLGLEGNKDPDLPEEERNMRWLVIIDDREFGQTGRFPLWWNPKTGLFKEM